MIAHSKKLFRLSQKALIYNSEDGTYLLLKAAKPQKDQPRYALWAKKYGPWDLPGGHVDDHEDDLMAAFMREVKEESGLDIGVDHMLCNIVLMHNEKAEHVGINHIYVFTYNQEPIELSDEHIEYRWMTADEIAESKEIKEWIKNSVVRAEILREHNDALDSWKRCLADFDNYKKRQAESQKEFIAYAAEGVIMDMLPILDNFHAATDHIPETEKDNPWVTGVMYIQQQMEKVLEEKGVAKINIQIGDEFDPHTMDAVKDNDDKEVNVHASVAKVAQPGYMMGAKVLRPARVIVTTNDGKQKG